MSSPIVQVLFQGRLLQCIPFEGEELRIGRRKDNDIVISNLSVSRRHAKLVRDDESIFLHDAGSENGCFLNGARVERTKKVEIGPDDELVIGKHRILIQWEDVAAESAAGEEDLAKTRAIPVPVPEDLSAGSDISPSEQWQAAIETPPSAHASTPTTDVAEEFEISVEHASEEFEVAVASDDETPESEAEESASFEESMVLPDDDLPLDSAFFEDAPSASENSSPDPVSIPESKAEPALSEVESANPDESGLFGSDPVKGPGLVTPKKAHTNPEIDLRDFDFDLEGGKPPRREPSPTVALPVGLDGAPVEDGSVTQGRALALPEENLNATQVVAQFPTLSIRNGEDAVRVVRWESPLLEVGRSSDCDIVLADPRVSRRHAEFEAEPDGYRVRDLESINFTFVNGEKITDRTLVPGDVVRIENFEITFQMDGLADTSLQPEPEAVANRSTNSMTMIKPSAREFDGPSAPLGEFDSDAAALTDPGTDISLDELALGGELESQLDSLSQGSFEDAEGGSPDLLSEVEAELELEMDDRDEGGDLFTGQSDRAAFGESKVEDTPTVPPIESDLAAEDSAEEQVEGPDATIVSPGAEPELDVAVAADAEPELDVTVAADVEPELDLAVAADVEPALDVAVAADVEPELDVAVAADVEPALDVAVTADVEPELDVAVAADAEPELDLAVAADVEPELDVAVAADAEPKLDPVAADAEPELDLAVAADAEPELEAGVAADAAPVLEPAESAVEFGGTAEVDPADFGDSDAAESLDTPGDSADLDFSEPAEGFDSATALPEMTNSREDLESQGVPAEDDTNAELLLAAVVEEPESQSVASPLQDAEADHEPDPLAAAMLEAADSIPDLAQAPDQDEHFSADPMSPAGAEESIDALFAAPDREAELTDQDDAPSLTLEEPLSAQTHLFDPLEHSDSASSRVGHHEEDRGLPPSPLAHLEGSPHGDESNDSLFGAGIEADSEARFELDEDKPLADAPEMSRLSDTASQVSFRADPSQTPVSSGKLSIEFALKLEDLSEPVRAILRETRQKGIVLPIEIRLKVED